MSSRHPQLWSRTVPSARPESSERSFEAHLLAGLQLVATLSGILLELSLQPSTRPESSERSFEDHPLADLQLAATLLGIPLELWSRSSSLTVALPNLSSLLFLA